MQGGDLEGDPAGRSCREILKEQWRFAKVHFQKVPNLSHFLHQFVKNPFNSNQMSGISSLMAEAPLESKVTRGRHEEKQGFFTFHEIFLFSPPVFQIPRIQESNFQRIHSIESSITTITPFNSMA